MAYSINLETCSKCRLCTEVCPSHVIGIKENKETYFIPERLSICLKCGQCMAVCQTGSITVDGLEYGCDLIKLPGSYPGYDQFVSLLSHRRSVRNYRNKPVPEEMVQQILETVSYAPFGSSPEKMHVTVINNREEIENAFIYTTYVILAAQALGLGAAMNGIVPAAINKVKSLQEYFNIPANHEAMIAVIAGWPKYKYRRSVKRNTLQVHWLN